MPRLYFFKKNNQQNSRIEIDYNTKLTATKNWEYCPLKRKRYLNLFITFLNTLHNFLSPLFCYSWRDWALNNQQHPKRSPNSTHFSPPKQQSVLFHKPIVKRTVCPNELLHWRLDELLTFYHKTNNCFSLLLILMETMLLTSLPTSNEL